MSKAENFTVRMDDELKQRMKEHPEINWSHVIREHVRSVIDDLERMDQLASDSQLTEADIEDLAAMIDAAAAERAQEDLAGAQDEGSSRSEADQTESSQRGDVTDADAA
jgi:hypothetical protein